MAELTEVASQFALDLKNQNIAGLMMAFTANGMGQAMMLQSQMQAGGQPQDPNATLSVVDKGEDAGQRVMDLVFEGQAGALAIVTRWVDVAGVWKVDGIALKP